VFRAVNKNWSFIRFVNTNFILNNQKIAYIDFDGTLVKSHCVHYLIKINSNIKSKFSFWVWRFFLQLKAPYFHFLNKTSSSKFDTYYYSYFKGLKTTQINEAMDKLLLEYMTSKLFGQAIDEIRRLKSEGYRIVIVSASLDLIVKPFAKSIDADHIIATTLETNNELFTGVIKNKSVNHHNKLKAIKEFEEKHQLTPEKRVSYGNSQWDIPMLDFADEAIAVNPDKNLALWAKENGTKCLQWQLENIPRRFHFLYMLLKPFVSSCEGLSHIPRNGGVIIISNHSSYLDHYLIGLSIMCRYGRRVRFLAKKEHFEAPLERWIHEWLGAFPIDRSKVSKQSLNSVVSLLNNNEIVLIYPEGTRSSDGKLQTFKPGVLFTHFQSNCPIVPAGINGAYEMLPRGKLIPRFSQKMGVKFGPSTTFLNNANDNKIPRGNIRRSLLNDLSGRVMGLMQ